MKWFREIFKKKMNEERIKPMGKHDDLVAKIKARLNQANDECDGKTIQKLAPAYDYLDQAEALLASIDSSEGQETAQ